MGSEWEMVNDEGFVYQRKKRSRIIGNGEAADPTAEEEAAAAAAVVELKERKKKRRRIALVKLKDKYKHELGVWQHLDTTLISMEQQQQQQQHQHLNQPSNINQQPHSILGFPSQSSFFLSHLFSQVEAQDAIIRDFSQLCEVAESLCSVHEEKAKQQFIDLPIWRSPRELMTSLCED
ncbi:uncharacterized protein LOC141623774 [Silene latifolia]|uniref:uncharacterized protein LOC141623774 n=1 Tax=Silene latifolia TaxID=37657 RepID=UPI003D77B74A